MISRPLPSDDPILLAWQAYSAGEEYENTKRWASKVEHIDGSLWAAFLAGWQAHAREEPPPQTSRRRLWPWSWTVGTVLGRWRGMARDRWILALLLLAIAAALLFLPVPAHSQELGKHLRSQGITRTIWVDFDNIRLRRFGTLDPGVTWSTAPDCWTSGCVALYEARYGAGSWRKKGTVVGERYSYDALSDYFLLRGIPGLPTRLDREDACMAAVGSVAWWDAVLLPAVAPQPPVVVPPVVTPPVQPPAVTPPVVTPPTTPPSADPLDAILAKLREVVADLEAIRAKPTPSTGRVTLGVFRTSDLPAGVRR